jgi:hypothetical protein
MLTFDFVSRRSQKPMPVMDHKKFMVGPGAMKGGNRSLVILVLDARVWLYLS